MGGTARMSGVRHGTDEEQPLIFYNKDGRVWEKPKRSSRVSKRKVDNVESKSNSDS